MSYGYLSLGVTADTREQAIELAWVDIRGRFRYTDSWEVYRVEESLGPDRWTVIFRYPHASDHVGRW